MTRRIFQAILTLALVLLAVQARAQAWPTRPITVLIGYPPGSVLDAVARPVFEEASKKLGQPFVIEFRAGASGSIAGKAVAAARPDGYTLHYSNLIVSSPALIKTNALDAARELSPITTFGTVPYGFFLRASFPATNWEELLAWTKANPGKLNFGSAGATSQVVMHILKQKTGLSGEGITYPGTPPIVAAMLAGTVDVMFGAPQSHLPQVKAGKTRALFVASGRRYSGLPDTPISSEVKIPDLQLATHYGLWGPAGMARDIVMKLHTELAAALKVPAVVNIVQNSQQVDIVAAGPEETLRIYESEFKTWSEAVRASGYQPQ